jgi:hypothetical protein
MLPDWIGKQITNARTPSVQQLMKLQRCVQQLQMHQFASFRDGELTFPNSGFYRV